MFEWFTQLPSHTEVITIERAQVSSRLQRLIHICPHYSHIMKHIFGLFGRFSARPGVLSRGSLRAAG